MVRHPCSLIILTRVTTPFDQDGRSLACTFWYTHSSRTILGGCGLPIAVMRWRSEAHSYSMRAVCSTCSVASQFSTRSVASLYSMWYKTRVATAACATCCSPTSYASGVYQIMSVAEASRRDLQSHANFSLPHATCDCGIKRRSDAAIWCSNIKTHAGRMREIREVQALSFCMHRV